VNTELMSFEVPPKFTGERAK